MEWRKEALTELSRGVPVDAWTKDGWKGSSIPECRLKNCRYGFLETPTFQPASRSLRF